LESCCEELKNSQNFGRILRWIHYLGNVLNKDTPLVATNGFALESLPKVNKTKQKIENLPAQKISALSLVFYIFPIF
jgi:hypothetical protein